MHYSKIWQQKVFSCREKSGLFTRDDIFCIFAIFKMHPIKIISITGFLIFSEFFIFRCLYFILVQSFWINWFIFWLIQYWRLRHIYRCYILIWRINKLLLPHNLYHTEDYSTCTGVICTFGGSTSCPPT